MSQQGQKFDLSEISRMLWVKWLRFKWANHAMAVAFFSLAAAVFVYSAITSSLAGDYLYKGRADFVFVAFFAVFAGLFVWSGHSVSKPATAVLVSQGGIEIQYPSYRPKVLEWTDASFHLKISTSYHPSFGGNLQGSQFWWKPRLFMKDEVANAIVTAARAHGMDVQTVDDPNSNTGKGILIQAPRAIPS